MRNLKKILALVLALMMVMSMMVVASAADFSDAADIQYDEAVEVLSALKVLEGYNGAFNPKGTLDRASAAKLVSHTALGSTDVKYIEQVPTSFADVAESHWASGFIAYCSQEGHINGYNGKFNPDALIDGYGFAKLLLCVMGIEGNYTGTEWTLAVATNAKKVGLTAGLAKTFKLSDTMTREAAAQMMLNALVYANSETGKYIVKAENTTNKTLVEAYTTETNGQPKVFDSMVDAAIYMNVMAGNNIVAGTDYTIEEYAAPSLLNKNFGIGFEPYLTGRDTYGRPANLYYKLSNNAVVVTYYPIAPAATYYAPVTKYQVLTDLGVVESIVNPTTISAEYWLDADVENNVLLSKYVEPINYETIANYGATTEVYYFPMTATYNHTVIVDVNTYLAKVTGVQTYRPATATLPVRYAYTTFAVQGLTGGTQTVTMTYGTNDYAVGDWVLVNIDANGRYYDYIAGGYTTGAYITNIEAATVVSGTVNKYNTASVTVNGITYNQAAKTKDYYTTDSAEFLAANYYLVDENNVVYGCAAMDHASTNYAYVLNYESTVGTTGSLLTNSSVPAAKAEVIFTNGTYAVIDLNIFTENNQMKVFLPAGNGTVAPQNLADTAGKQAVGAWVAYTVLPDGSYKLETISTKYGTTGTQIDLTANKANITLTSDTSNLSTYVLTADTVVTGFVVENNLAVTTSYAGLTNANKTFGAATNVGNDVLVTYIPYTGVISNIYVYGDKVTTVDSAQTYAYVYEAGDIVYNNNNSLFVQEMVMLIKGEKVVKNVCYTGTAFTSAPQVGTVVTLTANTTIAGAFDFNTVTTVNGTDNAIDNSQALSISAYRVALVDKSFVVLQGGTYANGVWTDAATSVVYYFEADGCEVYNVAFEWGNNGQADTLEVNDIVVVANGTANADVDLIYIVGNKF